MKSHVKPLAVAVLAAFSTNPFAQQVAADGAVIMAPVTVTGVADVGYSATKASTATKMDVPIRDVPQAIEVRTRQMLDDLGGTQTSYEVAKTVAGVFNAENGQGDPGRNVPNFIYRGYYNSGYLKDGHMVNSWMSTVDMANVERVEFLKGPASVLYGGSTYTGDIGGVVNYVSKLPQAARLAVGELTVGSNGFYRATADLGGALNEGKSAMYRLNGAVERSDSFRDFAKHDSQFIAPAFTFKLTPVDTLTLLMEAVRSHEIPGAGLPLNLDALGVPHTKNYIDPGFAKTDIQAQNIGVRYDHGISQDLRLNVDFSQTRSRTDQFDTFLYYNPGDVSTLAGSHWSLNNDQTELDVRLSGKATTGPFKHTLLVGANVQRNRYSAYSEFGWGGPSLDLSGTSLNELVLAPAGAMNLQYAATTADPGTYRWNSDTDALYFQDMVSASEQVKLLLGVRHDRFHNDSGFTGSFGVSADASTNSHTSPRIGVIFQPTLSTSIYAVQAQAFSPNTGITLNGVPPPPDIGELKEIGLKQALGARLNMNLALYALKRNNMAFTDPADPSGNAILVAGETRSRGIELDINGQLTDALRINIAASVMRGWITEGEPGGSLIVGSEFAAMPRKTLNVLGIYSFGDDKTWEIGGGVYYANEAWADGANTFKVPSIIQFDAQASYRFDRKTQLQVNVKNLTNRRNYTSNGWGWINPSDPVSLYATLRHEF